MTYQEADLSVNDVYTGLEEVREHIETIRKANGFLRQRIRAHEQYQGFWFFKKWFVAAPAPLTF